MPQGRGIRPVTLHSPAAAVSLSSRSVTIQQEPTVRSLQCSHASLVLLA